MNKRLKDLRKSLSLNQVEMGKRLGVTGAGISKLESGDRSITDQMFLSICREFNVNETWLRTGEGDMFVAVSRNKEIAKFVGDAIASETDDFKKRFILALSRLDERDWETLAKVAEELKKD